MLPRRPCLNLVFVLCLALAACGRSGGPAPVTYGNSYNQAQAPRQYHVVQRGETLYGISRAYNIQLRALIDRNGLEPPYLLRVGQRLMLPPPQVHVVQRGDTVYGISHAYGVPISELARMNGLRSPYLIQVGQRLVVPYVATARGGGATQTAAKPPAPVKEPPLPVPPKEKPQQQQAAKPQTPAKPAAQPLPEPPKSSGRFLWPLSGKIISGFGAKPGGLHNDGVNIQAAAGARVRAAESGVVAYASDELKGFGNLLLIKHDGGWVSAYAHNARLLVSRGQTVKRGQDIALVGATGAVSSPQLHFELRKGSQPVDPLKYLPAQTSQR
jgi:murein DD-endopeptidase MepM/ murein hydrolase activator NlpD